jgi:hypothetical protein
MFRIPEFAIPLVLVLGLAIKGLGLFAIVYIGARLAIRHERRISN